MGLHRDHVKCNFLDASFDGTIQCFDICQAGNVHLTRVFSVLTIVKEKERKGLNDRDWQTEPRLELARRICFIFVWDSNHNKAHKVKLRPLHWVKVASHWSKSKEIAWLWLARLVALLPSDWLSRDHYITISVHNCRVIITVTQVTHSRPWAWALQIGGKQDNK